MNHQITCEFLKRQSAVADALRATSIIGLFGRFDFYPLYSNYCTTIKSRKLILCGIRLFMYQHTHTHTFVVANIAVCVKAIHSNTFSRFHSNLERRCACGHSVGGLFCSQGVNENAYICDVVSLPG